MSERMRIDKWLWHARFFRSRILAQQAAQSGQVRLNGARVVKSGHGVKVGDFLTVPAGGEALVVRVVAFGEKRAGAPLARQLYEIVAAPALDRNSPAP